jgi:hypothetical protein
LQWAILPNKNEQQNAALRQYTPQARSPFWLLKPASEYAHSRLLPILSSWTVLLSGHTENLLCPLHLFYFHLWPYLLTLPRSCIQRLFVKIKRTKGDKTNFNRWNVSYHQATWICLLNTSHITLCAYMPISPVSS